LAANREIIYIGRNNRFDVILKEDGTAVDLSGVTHINVVFNSGTSVSSVARSTWFDWTSGASGEVRFSFGGTTVTPGYYDAEVLVYDVVNTSGINWGTIPILIKG